MLDCFMFVALKLEENDVEEQVSRPCITITGFESRFSFGAVFMRCWGDARNFHQRTYLSWNQSTASVNCYLSFRVLSLSVYRVS